MIRTRLFQPCIPTTTRLPGWGEEGKESEQTERPVMSTVAIVDAQQLLACAAFGLIGGLLNKVIRANPFSAYSLIHCITDAL